MARDKYSSTLHTTHPRDSTRTAAVSAPALQLSDDETAGRARPSHALIEALPNSFAESVVEGCEVRPIDFEPIRELRLSPRTDRLAIHRRRGRCIRRAARLSGRRGD